MVWCPPCLHLWLELIFFYFVDPSHEMHLNHLNTSLRLSIDDMALPSLPCKAVSNLIYSLKSRQNTRASLCSASQRNYVIWDSFSTANTCKEEFNIFKVFSLLTNIQWGQITPIYLKYWAVHLGYCQCLNSYLFILLVIYLGTSLLKTR